MANRKLKGRVLYVGQAYYNAWYLSRTLRELGWQADVLNVDPNEHDQIYYHGEDFTLPHKGGLRKWLAWLHFYLRAVRSYDIFHFSNAHNLRLMPDPPAWVVARWLISRLPTGWEIKLLKILGKKIVYTNNGCLDGVAQSSFRQWPPEPVCDICRWRDVPAVCSDERNLAWGKFRNSLADYQMIIGGNRKDYNIDPRVHEMPGFFCLDPDFWSPDLLIPTNYRLPLPKDTIKLFHAVGNFDLRTMAGNRNIKSTHIYIPLVERLKTEGYNVELIFFQDVPNTKLRYYQAQADIFVDMLTFGWFGALAREGMMLGKPVVCFLRPQWLDNIRRELPEYVDDLPVVSATPQTIETVLKDLLDHPQKRQEIGRRSREFAVKWHSAEAGAKQVDRIYLELLNKLTKVAK